MSSREDLFMRSNQVVDESRATSQEEERKSFDRLTQDSSAKFNLDMALAKVGGFGRYQTLTTLGISLLRCSGSILSYMFAYLVLVQEYECRTDPATTYDSCSADQICRARGDGTYIEYRVDTTYDNYMVNWQQECDLMCMATSKVNLLLVIHFIAFGIGGVLTFPVMDKIGRRKTHYIFSTFHLIGQALIVYEASFWGKAIGYAIIGFAMAKNSLCYAWLFEFMVKDKKSAASSAINALDYSITIVSGIYFLYLSEDTKPLIIGYFLLTGVLGWLIVTALVTESPKWLLLQGRREEAISALNFIATVNGSKQRIPSDAMFIECVLGQNLENNQSHDLNISTSQRISNLSYRSFRSPQSRLSSAVRRARPTKRRSFVIELAYLCLIMQSIEVMYYSMYFMATLIGGNIFVNSIFVGVGEVAAALISGWMLSKFKDSHCFISFNIMTGLGMLLFYMMPAGFFQYLCFLLCVFGVASMLNTIYVMTELRIPPEYTGAAIVIVTTVGTMTASLAPFVAQAPHPFPMVITIILCIMNIGLTCALSEPGAYLPDAVKLSENVTLLRLDNISQVINDSVMNPGPGHNDSFQRTHFEITNNVERTRLNETNMDPDLLNELLADDTKNNVSFQSHKRWDWELLTSPKEQNRLNKSQTAESDHFSTIQE